MHARTALQVIVILAGLALVAYLALTLIEGWAGWLVLVVCAVALYGGALAVNQRSYPSKRRSFVRNWDDRE